MYFTGQERDAESNLDHMGARYYSSQFGRFVSPDTTGISLANLGDPQQLNLYAYTRNNPISNIDPTGLDCAYLNDAGNGIESTDTNSNSSECSSNGGFWVNGQVNQVSVNPNGTYQFGYSGTLADGSLGIIAYNGYLSPTSNSFGQFLSDGFVGMFDAFTGRQPTTVGQAQMIQTNNLFMGFVAPEGEAGEIAEGTAVDANKLNHIFGDLKHGLESLVSRFGSQEAAYKGLQQATEAVVRERGLAGVFEVPVQVAGETITVRGNVVGGAVRIGTAFK